MNWVHMSTTMNGIYPIRKKYCDDDGGMLDCFMKSALSKLTLIVEEDPCPLPFLSFTMS